MCKLAKLAVRLMVPNSYLNLNANPNQETKDVILASFSLKFGKMSFLIASAKKVQFIINIVSKKEFILMLVTLNDNFRTKSFY